MRLKVTRVLWLTAILLAASQCAIGALWWLQGRRAGERSAALKLTERERVVAREMTEQLRAVTRGCAASHLTCGFALTLLLLALKPPPAPSGTGPKPAEET